MPNNPSSLQARLDAMVDKQPFSATREDCVYAVALDLLQRLDELEALVKEVVRAHACMPDYAGTWVPCECHVCKFNRAAILGEHHG